MASVFNNDGTSAFFMMCRRCHVYAWPTLPRNNVLNVFTTCNLIKFGYHALAYLLIPFMFAIFVTQRIE